jgi:hypothetical protein
VVTVLFAGLPIVWTVEVELVLQFLVLRGDEGHDAPKGIG